MDFTWDCARKLFVSALVFIQGQFKNRRKSRSRRGNEAEVFFVSKSASLRRRLQFLITPFFFILVDHSCIGQSPVLQYAVPAAVAPGKTTTLTFFGEKLNGATELWTGFPAQVSRVSSDKTNGTSTGEVAFQLSVPNTVPAGIGAVQLATTNGLSNLHLVLIDDLPRVAESGTNKSIASAQELKLPVAVDGNSEELSFDYYAFKAKKGQRVSVEVVANRLGSPLDPVVRLLDEAGKELAYCDDDPAAGSDSRLSFTSPATGRYVIELRDIGYQGGSKFRYRLRVGNFPLASAPFPLGARRGSQTKVMFVGRAVDGVRPVNLRVPEDAARVPLNARFPGGKACGFVTLATSRLPELMEIEPNETPETATKIPVPSVVNGRFAKPRDRDWYEFSASQGQRLVFSGRTRSLGSPCDLFMRLFNGDGKQLAEADISGANEGTLTNKFSEAGTYRLFVEELNRGGEPDFVYRIEVEPFQPGFVLSLETNRVEAASEASFELKVTAARREYDGPIKLSLEGLGEDFVLENNVIAEKKNETSLKVKLPERFEAGQMFHFTIVGRARVNDADYARTASTMPALRRLWPLLRYPPAELDGLIGLGIKPPASRPEEEKPAKPK